MYNSRYNDGNRGRDSYGSSNDYGGRSSNYRDNYPSGNPTKRSNYDERGEEAYAYSNSAAKRPRDVPDLQEGYAGSSRGSALLDAPRYDRSHLLRVEEERLRQLEEIARLKREHELTLLRRTLDMNRREVQEALNSRGEGGNRGSYGRDRHMGYDGGRRGLDDRGRGDSNQRDRYRRDSPGRPRVRDRSPPRRRSRSKGDRFGPNRREFSRGRDRSSSNRSRSRARSQRERSPSKTKPKSPVTEVQQEWKCELCNVKFKSAVEKIEHEEKNEKHIYVMKKLQSFSESSGTTMDELVEKFLRSRSNPQAKEEVAGLMAKEESGNDDASKDATGVLVDAVKDVKPEDDPERFPGLYYTGERWRVRVYNPDLIMGPDFIVPVTGWYCVLCEKFYYNESPAKTNHCQNKAHWENLRAWLKENGHKYEPLKYDEFVKAAEIGQELKGKTEGDMKAAAESGASTRTEEIIEGIGDLGESNGIPVNEADETKLFSVTVKDEPIEDVTKSNNEQSSEMFFETTIGKSAGHERIPSHNLNEDALDMDYEEDDYTNEDDLTKAAMTSRNGNKTRGDLATSSEKENSRIRSTFVESNKQMIKDSRMLSMFDNLEAILSGTEEQEIPVSVVEEEEDPFRSPRGCDRLGDGGDDADTDFFQEPPIEEIRMDNSEDSEIMPPTSEVEEETEEEENDDDNGFVVREESVDEPLLHVVVKEGSNDPMADGHLENRNEERTRSSSNASVLSGNADWQTPQLSIIEDNVDPLPPKASPKSNDSSPSTKQTARRGGTRGGRGARRVIRR